MLNSSGYTVEAPHAEHVEDHECDTDVNGGVRHIESPEVPATLIEVEEVQYVAEQNPVDEVADRAADDERQAQTRQPLLWREHGDIDRQSDQGGRLEERQYRRLEGEVEAVHQTERRARVVDARQAEKARND